jgi:SagB-type dehydrogenase family enzyme
MIKQPIILLFLAFLPSLLYAEEGMIIKLPAPKEKGVVSLEEAIKHRRSERSLSGAKLSLEQISQLLWSCQGITDEKSLHRAAPSAGATYPLEVYLVNSEGLFYYIPDSHSLEKIENKDLRGELSQACFGQGFVSDASIDIIICADFKRTTSRYSKRGINYVYIEVGHAAENLHLEAVSLGLGSVPVGAFSEAAVQKVLNLPKGIIPIYVVPVGYIRE